MRTFRSFLGSAEYRSNPNHVLVHNNDRTSTSYIPCTVQYYSTIRMRAKDGEVILSDRPQRKGYGRVILTWLRSGISQIAVYPEKSIDALLQSGYYCTKSPVLLFVSFSKLAPADSMSLMRGYFVQKRKHLHITSTTTGCNCKSQPQ